MRTNLLMMPRRPWRPFVSDPLAAPAGWPADVAPGNVITAEHMNAVRTSVYSWPADVNAGGHNLIDTYIVTTQLVDAFQGYRVNGVSVIASNGAFNGSFVETPGVVVAGSHVATRGGQFWVQDAAGTVNLAILGSDGLYFQGVQSIRGDGAFVGPIGVDTVGPITSHNAVVLAGGIFLIRDAAQTVNKASIDADGNATFANVNVSGDLVAVGTLRGKRLWAFPIAGEYGLGIRSHDGTAWDWQTDPLGNLGSPTLRSIQGVGALTFADNTTQVTAYTGQSSGGSGQPQTPWASDINGAAHILTNVDQIYVKTVGVRGGELYVQSVDGSSTKAFIDGNGNYISALGNIFLTAGNVQAAAALVYPAPGQNGLHVRDHANANWDWITNSNGDLVSATHKVLSCGGAIFYENVSVINQIDSGNDLRLYNTAFAMSNRGRIQWAPSLNASDPPDCVISRYDSSTLFISDGAGTRKGLILGHLDVTDIYVASYIAVGGVYAIDPACRFVGSGGVNTDGPIVSNNGGFQAFGSTGLGIGADQFSFRDHDGRTIWVRGGLIVSVS